MPVPLRSIPSIRSVPEVVSRVRKLARRKRLPDDHMANNAALVVLHGEQRRVQVLMEAVLEVLLDDEEPVDFIEQFFGYPPRLKMPMSEFVDVVVEGADATGSAEVIQAKVATLPFEIWNEVKDVFERQGIPWNP